VAGAAGFCRDVRGEPATPFLSKAALRHMPLKGDSRY
jgi:hypothetical protein